MNGYNWFADGGQGVFSWNPTSTRYADTGMTIQPSDVASGAAGRWERMVFEQDTRINVLWFGADRTCTSNANGLDSTNAITMAWLVCKTFKGDGTDNSAAPYAPATSILKLYFPSGGYRFDGIAMGYVDAEVCGDGGGTTRIYQNNGCYNPVFYFQGGGYNTAAPYGGCHDISVAAGTNCLGAVVYVDTTIDQGFNMDGLWVAGSLATGVSAAGVNSPIDGISAHDFLNSGQRRNRFDGIGGYALTFRATKGSASVLNPDAGYKFASTAINIATGGITVANMTPLEPGAAVMWFNTIGNTPPTITGASAPLATGEQGVCYYVALGSTANTIYLSTTRAGATEIGSLDIMTFSSAGTGSNGLVVFRANFDVLATTATTYQYNQDKAVIIATSFLDSTAAITYASTSTYTTGLVSTNGIPANAATHVVYVACNGTYPVGITPGMAYYPRYVDGQTIQLYATPAEAANTSSTSGQVNLSGAYTGELTLLYSSNCSVNSLAHHVIDDFTWDNTDAPTSQTLGAVNGVGGTACGGYGLLYADFANMGPFKGGIEFKNSRVEINKALATDTRSGALVPNIMRIVGANVSGGTWAGPTVGLLTENLHFALATSVPQHNIRVMGTPQGEMSYMIRNVSHVGMAEIVQNDTYNMVGAIQGMSNSAENGRIIEATNSTVPNAYMNNAAVTKWGGMHWFVGNTTGTANSIMQQGDLLWNRSPTGPLVYKAVNAQQGFSLGAGGATGITVASVAGSNVFTVTGTIPQQLAPGTSVSIATAADGTNPLVGVVRFIGSLAVPLTFELLVPSTGLPQNAGVTSTGMVVSYSPTTFAQVDAWQVYLLTATFTTAIAAGAEGAVNVTVPGALMGLSATSPNAIIPSWPSSLPAGLIPFAFVYTAYAVQVRVLNTSAASWSGSINFSLRVAK